MRISFGVVVDEGAHVCSRHGARGSTGCSGSGLHARESVVTRALPVDEAPFRPFARRLPRTVHICPVSDDVVSLPADVQLALYGVFVATFAAGLLLMGQGRR
jgi:hypothetical protein